MNERIKELAEQAGYNTSPYCRIDREFDLFEIEKFAKLVQEDERTKFCTFLMKLHKQYKHQHNHFHVAAVNLWEEKA